MNKYFNLILTFLIIQFVFSSCQHKLSKSELDALEEQRIDSIMKAKKTFAKDSISKRGDVLFADFRFGMSEREYKNAEMKFKEETNGNIDLLDLKFSLYMPTYDNGKLSCLALGATDYVNSSNGHYYRIDYFTLLKDHYTNKFGLPDLFLDENYQETDSKSDDVVKVFWMFDNRVISLTCSEFFQDKTLVRYYYIYYYTPDEWNKTKEYFDKLYLDKIRKMKEIEDKGKKYSNDI